MRVSEINVNESGRGKSVVMLSPHNPKTVGGPNNYIRNLRAELENIGWVVSVLSLDLDDSVPAFKNAFLCRYYMVFRSLLRLRPDVVHIHGCLHIIPCSYLYKVVSANPVRIVFSFHTQPRLRDYLNPDNRINPSYSGITGSLGTFFLKLCDVVTSVSASILTNINSGTNMRIPSAAVVIPSGAVVPDLGVVRLSDFDRKPVVLTTIGVMNWDWKVAGYKICFEGIAIVKNKYPDIILQVVGDGAYRNYLEEYSRFLGIGENIRFLGNRSGVEEILVNSDIYVHMALNEGCSLAIVEAMMVGKPIVAANCGGTPEIIEDEVTGLLVAPSPGEFAAAISRLLNSPEFSNLLQRNAAKISRSKFSWEFIAANFSRVYN